MSITDRAARLTLAAPFVWAGYEAVREPGGRVAMAADFGMPRPELAVRLNGGAMVVGGLAMAAGVLPRVAALGLAGSLVPTTLAGHAFWEQEDPKARAANRIQFVKNLGLIGGLLAVAAR